MVEILYESRWLSSSIQWIFDGCLWESMPSLSKKAKERGFYNQLAKLEFY